MPEDSRYEKEDYLVQYSEVIFSFHPDEMEVHLGQQIFRLFVIILFLILLYGLSRKRCQHSAVLQTA